VNKDIIKHSKKYLIVLTGPTAVGKTEVVLELYSKLNAALISADSRQVYKEMRIGTAKPSVKQVEDSGMALVDHVNIKDPYNVGIYEREAIELIDQAYDQERLPILTGGTGLYIKAVCEGLNSFPEVPQEIIDDVNDDLYYKGLKFLQNELKAKDPEYYESIDKENTHRIQRAVSVIRVSDNPFSYFLNKEKPKRDFEVVNVILHRERPILYDRINKRVMKMIESGLEEEVRSLIPHQNLKALQSVGYTELFRYFDGEWDIDKAISEIQKNTRRYAKRQVTWFKNQMVGKYFEPENIKGILEYIQTSVSK